MGFKGDPKWVFFGHANLPIFGVSIPPRKRFHFVFPCSAPWKWHFEILKRGHNGPIFDPFLAIFDPFLVVFYPFFDPHSPIFPPIYWVFGVPKWVIFGPLFDPFLTLF